MANCTVTISHWLPMVTICPVNKLPDLLYVSVTVENKFVELYAARKRMRKVVNFKYGFMEDLAANLWCEFPEASQVTVSLLCGRHKVVITEELPHDV